MTFVITTMIFKNKAITLFFEKEKPHQVDGVTSLALSKGRTFPLATVVVQAWLARRLLSSGSRVGCSALRCYFIKQCRQEVQRTVRTSVIVVGVLTPRSSKEPELEGGLIRRLVLAALSCVFGSQQAV